MARRLAGCDDTGEDADEAALSGSLSAWEALVVEAVGSVISFWKFKRNHGRVWALLYLRDEALDAPTLQARLGLSKGAVSMLTRELEEWGVLHRVRNPNDVTWRFNAETNFLRMVGRVIEKREAALLRRVREDLERAEQMARADRAAATVISRISKMRALAHGLERAMNGFRSTARFDFTGAADLLTHFRGRVLKGKRPTKQ
jgi:DNA-binding transcriptional regulator GbsR (MarR family)